MPTVTWNKMQVKKVPASSGIHVPKIPTELNEPKKKEHRYDVRHEDWD